MFTKNNETNCWYFKGSNEEIGMNIVLISKDVLRKDYLPCYGNKYWKTPNIDYLVQNGIVFDRHYTAAPSTAMSFTSMFTGKYP